MEMVQKIISVEESLQFLKVNHPEDQEKIELINKRIRELEKV
jgi:hypothetical protein